MRRILELLSPKLPASLREQPAWARILPLAERFPPLSGGILEWHLDGPANRLDFSVRGHHVGRWSSVHWEQRSLSSSLRPRLVGSRKRIAPPRGKRLVGVRPSGKWCGAPVVPAFFFDLRSPRRVTVKRTVAAVTEGLRQLGQLPPPDFAAALFRQLYLLPANVRLRYIGIFPGRQGSSPRLCLTGWRAAQIVPFLAAGHWPGDAATLREALAGFTPGADRLQLNIDLAASPAARVSFEISVTENERWGPLVERLAAAGLCSPETAAACRLAKPAPWLRFRGSTIRRRLIFLRGGPTARFRLR